MSRFIAGNRKHLKNSKENNTVVVCFGRNNISTTVLATVAVAAV